MVKQYSPIFEGGELQVQDDMNDQWKKIIQEENERRKNEPKKDDNNFGWLALVNQLSKTGQYGDYEKTQYTNVHTVLYNYSMDIIQARNNKQNNPNDLNY
jgi:hypothetical protein